MGLLPHYGKDFMNKFNFEIDPEELPFRGEDDLGDDEPRIVEWIAKKIHEQNVIHIMNPVAMTKAMKLVNAIVSSITEWTPSAKCSVAYDPLVGKNLVLTIISSTMFIDGDLLDKVRELDGGIIDSMDISTRADETTELNIAFKDVMFRIAQE